MMFGKKKPAVQPQVPEYTFQSDDFQLKNDTVGVNIDSNFASQSYWKDVYKRFVSNKGALVALVLIVIITFFAIVGPGMNPYSYAEQNLSEKNFAPRVPGLEKLGTVHRGIRRGYVDKNKSNPHHYSRRSRWIFHLLN